LIVVILHFSTVTEWPPRLGEDGQTPPGDEAEQMFRRETGVTGGVEASIVGAQYRYAG
jgi:hypothetical protein